MKHHDASWNRRQYIRKDIDIERLYNIYIYVYANRY